MRTHSFVAFISTSFLVAALFLALPRVAHAQLIAGSNVNVVGGPACSNDPNNPFYKPNCPAKVFGDLTIQRQNEGSMDCSSRNAANCLAAGNDYKLVGVTGPQDGKVTGDAWLGLYWTHNGGTTWRNSLLPGWKSSDPAFYDNSPEGQASPLFGLEASADATVRTGTGGLFYVSGVAFNRSGEQNGAGAIGKTGVMFVATFIDDNNTSDPNHGPRYLRTTVVDNGTSGQFLDKPWIVADIPRGTATCTIPASADVPAQTIAAGVLYAAYSTFLGSGNNPHTDIWIRSSADCGATWSNGAKLTASIPLGQSAILALAPNGDLWAAWREFGLGVTSDRIWAARSTNGGKMFSKATVVADLGVAAPTSTAYDPETMPNDSNPTLRAARSHDFPALCVGSDGVAHVAFSKRNANGWARIMTTTSTNPSTWSPLVAIDDQPLLGHQFQPTLACTGPQVTAAWYDERNDNAFTLGNIPYVLTPFIIDPTPPPPIHTIDVRAAQTPKNGGAFEPSIQVSHYPITYNGPNADPQFLQTKYNFINLPLFSGGTMPFIGDYIDIVAKNKFLPPIAGAGWAFNDYANETANVNVIWTDNRDVLEIASAQGDDNTAIAGAVNGINFLQFAAPGTEACSAPALTVTRNQNLYEAPLGRGLLTQIDGNARRTPSLKLRGYVIALYNFAKPAAGSDGIYGTGDDIKKKRFKLSFVTGGGPASFGFDPQTFELDPQATQLFVEINSFYGTARTVFVPKDSTAAVIVQVTEVDASGNAVPGGLQSRTVIAPDPNAPTQPLPDEDRTATLEQVLFTDGTNSFTTINYTPLQISSNTILGNQTLFSSINLGDINLGDINLGDINLGDINLGDINLGDINLGDINLGDINLGDINLGDINLGDINLGDINLGDTPIATKTIVTTTNTGNVDSSYDLNALIQNLPAGALMQVTVSRLLVDPTSKDCTTFGNQAVLRTLAGASSTTGIAATSFSLPPGGVGVITLQAVCGATDHPNGCFTTSNLSAVVRQQAPNCDSSSCTPLGTNVIDNVPPVLTLPSNITTPATSIAGAVVTFNATANDFVDGSITPTCTSSPTSNLSSGSTFPIGTTTIECSATDAHTNTGSGSFTVTVTNAPPVATAQSLSFVEDSVGNAVTLTGSDVESEPLTFTVLTLPTHGTLAGTAPNLTYSPAPNYNGGDSFTFKVSDSVDSLPATVSITVIAVNDAPVANPDTVSTPVIAGGTVNIAVLANDTDVDNAPSTLTVGAITTAPAHGTATISADGKSINYTADNTFAGSDSFQYTAKDPGGAQSAPATVTLTDNLGFNGLLSPYKANQLNTGNLGGAFPIVWQYTNSSNQVIDSSGVASMLYVKFNQVVGANANTCAGGTEIGGQELLNRDFPGNSNFQYFTAANPHPTAGPNTWQFNWKLISPVTAGCWRARVILDLNGNGTAGDAGDQVNTLAGFLIKVK